MPRFAKLSKKARNRRSAGAWAAGQVASGDFTNIATANAADGTYTLNGEDAELTDIVNLAHPDSSFDPADIDAGGITPHDAGGGSSQESTFFLNDALVTQLLAGYTAVLEFTADADGAGTAIQVFAADPDYEVSPGVQLGSRLGAGETPSVNLTTTLSGASPNSVAMSDGLHKIAITATTEKLAFSYDGSAIVSVSEPGIDGTMDKIYFSVGGELATSRLRSFAFYEPVDDADLPALSTL